jgi:hypothetical protein
MNEPTHMPRRQLLKLGAAALATIPIMIVFREQAQAATNAAMRSSLKYQDKPNGDQHCGTCMQFVPGKDPKARGGCKVIPGDTEISPNGWCSAWTKKS